MVSGPIYQTGFENLKWPLFILVKSWRILYCHDGGPVAGRVKGPFQNNVNINSVTTGQDP